MTVHFFIEIIILIAGTAMVIARKRLSMMRFLPSRNFSNRDWEDVFKVKGYWLLLFSATLLIRHWYYFPAKYFVSIGLIIGIIVAFINAVAWMQMSKSERNDKYSGGDSGAVLIGILGFFLIPMISLLAGYLIKIIVL